MTRPGEEPGAAPLEVEVERLPEGADPERTPPRSPSAGRAARELGPVVAGLVIDALDVLTPTPILGLVLGGLLGHYLARSAGARGGQAFVIAAGVALYCALPVTGRWPVATLVGLFVRAERYLRGEG